jgi:CTP:phosphocholine cytidylyltransferase-like protein
MAQTPEKKMIAVVMAGGLGSRMRPLTYTIPAASSIERSRYFFLKVYDTTNINRLIKFTSTRRALQWSWLHG